MSARLAMSSPVTPAQVVNQLVTQVINGWDEKKALYIRLMASSGSESSALVTHQFKVWLKRTKPSEHEMFGTFCLLPLVLTFLLCLSLTATTYSHDSLERLQLKTHGTDVL
jgi:hypothetical protein